MCVCVEAGGKMPLMRSMLSSFHARLDEPHPCNTHPTNKGISFAHNVRAALHALHTQPNAPRLSCALEDLVREAGHVQLSITDLEEHPRPAPSPKPTTARLMPGRTCGRLSCARILSVRVGKYGAMSAASSRIMPRQAHTSVAACSGSVLITW